MSDAAPTRAWRFYVEDMVSFCDKALAYTRGLDRASFRLDPMRYDATLRNLELSNPVPSQTMAAEQGV